MRAKIAICVLAISFFLLFTISDSKSGLVDDYIKQTSINEIFELSV